MTGRSNPPRGPSSGSRRLKPWARNVLDGPADGPFYVDALALAGVFGDDAALKLAREAFSSAKLSEDRRLSLLGVLVASDDESILDPVEAVFVEPARTSTDFRAQVLGRLAGLDTPKVAEIVLRNYAAMEPDLKPKALELLTQRPAWGRMLLKAVVAKSISRDALNLTQVRKLRASKDTEVVKSVREIWGTIRDGRNPERERVINGLRQAVRSAHGDARAGAVVFKNLCGQCHKIYGEGQEVGPELTSNGRASFEQLLSNLLDPSLVIGEAYQATLVSTTDGRVLTGLRVEDTPERIAAPKIQGGKLEVVPRDKGRRGEGQPPVAHAGRPGEAAEAAGAGRPPRLPVARQAAGRPRGPANPRHAGQPRGGPVRATLLLVERELDATPLEQPVEEVADRPRAEPEPGRGEVGRDVEDEVRRAGPPRRDRPVAGGEAARRRDESCFRRRRRPGRSGGRRLPRPASGPRRGRNPPASPGCARPAGRPGMSRGKA